MNFDEPGSDPCVDRLGCLPSALRESFERATGADLSDVRLALLESAAALGAPALCCGNVIYVAKDSYHPETLEGRKLLAHEVVHVLQQRSERLQAHGGLIVDPGLEAEAEALAPRLLDGLKVDLLRGRCAPRPGILQPYTVFLQAQLAANHIDLNTATFPGHECGLANNAANNETFLAANGNANIVVRAQNAVDLRLSDSQEMAIEHTNVALRQVRNFFASSMVITTSNFRLEQAGSGYRLAKIDDGNGGHRSILVGAVNPKTLYQVKLVTKLGASTSGGSVNCDDVAGTTMGESSKHKRTAKISTAGNNIFHGVPKWTVGDDLAFRIAIMLTEYIFNARDYVAAKQAADNGYTTRFNRLMQDAGNDRAAQILALGQVFGPIGEFYGVLIRKALAQQQMHRNGRTINGGLLQTTYYDLCRKLGINAWADPRIGDTYYTYSVGKIEKFTDLQNRDWNGMEDFVALRPLNNARVMSQPVWEFHWGAVVAESGAERITFENYARNYEDRDCLNHANQEDRHFVQMSHVPAANSNNNLNGQSWHESCYAVGFANAMTLCISRLSKCGR